MALRSAGEVAGFNANFEAVAILTFVSRTGSLYP